MSLQNRNILDIKRRSQARTTPARRVLFTPVQKSVRLKTRKRRQRLLTFCICVLCGAGLVGGLGAASRVERFAINDVQVLGAKEIPAESLTASVSQTVEGSLFKLFSKKNIFLYPKGEIKRTLSNTFPRIKNISLARSSLFAQAVMVTVEERRAFARWCSEACYVMDEDGFIFAEYSEGTEVQTPYVFREGLLPDTQPIGQTFLRVNIDDVVSLLSKLYEIGLEPSGVMILNENDFTVALVVGPTLYVPFAADSEAIVRNLRDAIESDTLKGAVEKLTYIDLRFGNRVYFK